jgi:hypothetical protein
MNFIFATLLLVSAVVFAEIDKLEEFLNNQIRYQDNKRTPRPWLPKKYDHSEDNYDKNSIVMNNQPNAQGVPDITFCNTSVTPCIINSYSISPDNIQPNENITLTLQVTLTETVTSGTISVKVKVHKFPVYSDTLDLCTEISQGGYTCPLQPQVLNIKQNIAIEKIPVSGLVELYTQVLDQDNKELLCMDVSVTI